jgi:hypothetical protein
MGLRMGLRKSHTKQNILLEINGLSLHLINCRDEYVSFADSR